jgi:hypothetical protein
MQESTKLGQSLSLRLHAKILEPVNRQVSIRESLLGSRVRHEAVDRHPALLGQPRERADAYNVRVFGEAQAREAIRNTVASSRNSTTGSLDVPQRRTLVAPPIGETDTIAK